MSDGPRKLVDADSLLAKDHRPENRAQRPAMVWKQLPMPVIGSLHGVVWWWLPDRLGYRHPHCRAGYQNVHHGN